MRVDSFQALDKFQLGLEQDVSGSWAKWRAC